MTPELIAKLKEAASKATKGKWRENIWTGPIEWHDGIKASICAHGPMHLFKEGENLQPINDAEYIALCSPDNILGLIEENEKLREGLRDAKETIEFFVEANEIDIEDSQAGIVLGNIIPLLEKADA